jgi:hypothetical protein
MIEDLPTDWSPKKIILYFIRPPPTVLDDMLIFNLCLIELIKYQDSKLLTKFKSR